MDLLPPLRKEPADPPIIPLGSLLSRNRISTEEMDRGQRGATLRNFRAETTSDGFTREMGTFERVGNDGKVLFRLLSELPACVLGRSWCSETLGYLCFIAATNCERLAR